LQGAIGLPVVRDHRKLDPAGESACGASMHIVHVLSVSLWGGPSQAVVNLLADGARRGWRMSLILLEHHGAALERLRSAAEGVGAEVLTVASAGRVDPSLPRRLRALISALDPDIVHCHGYKPALAALLAEPRRRRPRVMTVHGWTAATPALRFYEWLERRFLVRPFQRVFVVSPALRDHLLRLGLAPSRVIWAPNGFDFARQVPDVAAVREMRSRWGLAGQDRVVGSIGRLRPEKGQDVLVRAMAGIQRIPLVLVGDGPFRADLERLAAELSIAPAPLFAGETDRPLTALAAFDVVTVPSRTEGLPQTLVEAMAIGKPIVASAVGGVPEALGQGECGILVPPDDPGALRAGIRRLLDQADLAAGFGSRAQEHAERVYAMTVIGDIVEREYRAVLQESR
jgi:glycosyltransferase involved in cell wall biosynthesis